MFARKHALVLFLGAFQLVSVGAVMQPEAMPKLAAHGLVRIGTEALADPASMVVRLTSSQTWHAAASPRQIEEVSALQAIPPFAAFLVGLPSPSTSR
jgi:hypothetical protein